MEANENEEGMQKALGFGLREFNKPSNDKYHSRVSRVVRVRKQIVSGAKYYIEAELGRTTCTKSMANLESCPYHEDSTLQKRSLCEFVVYTVPWMGKTTLLKNECKVA
ncbi:cystatin-C-like [Notamacropus eugenii]|uniref:cystatin-C-like n=1 Tax=Notamacropus eugenii TaxID=9315 RepID=UPI003B66C0A8